MPNGLSVVGSDCGLDVSGLNPVNSHNFNELGK